MKFIFLDIDGVLNSIDLSVSARMIEKNKRHRLHDMDPVRVGLLMWLVKQTDAQIVISSTWRIGRTAEWFEGYFEALGWPIPPIHGCTPRNVVGMENGIGRGDEVNEYLNHHDFDPKECKYVIFDDDSDFYDWQPFIHIDRITGLTLRHIFEALDILEPAEDADQSAIDGLRSHVDFKRK